MSNTQDVDTNSGSEADPLDVPIVEGEPEVVSDPPEASSSAETLASDLETPMPLAASTTPPEQHAAAVEKAKSFNEPSNGLDPSSLPPLAPPGPPKDESPFTASAADKAQWSKEIEIYEREAEQLDQDPKAALLHLEVGRIYEEHLAKPRQAATSYQKAFTLDPNHPSILHASRRLFTEVGNWGMVLEILGYEIDAAESPEKKAALLSERGLILESKQRNPDQAQEAFKEALTVHSADPIALDALERIHQFNRNYEELGAIYERALSVSVSSQRKVPVLIAAAQLAEDRQEDPDRAIELYRQVLAEQSDNPLGLEALRRLCLQTQRWPDYVDVLTKSAEFSQTPGEAAQYLLAAARVQTEKLEAVDQALYTLLKALEYAPEDLVILREIEILYEQNSRFDEVVKVLRREAEVTDDPRERVPILFKLGNILESELNEHEQAVEVLQEAVSLMPSYVPAKQALGRLYGRLERWEDLTQLFEMEIRLEEDASGRVAKLFKLAELRAVRLKDEEQAIASLSELLTVQPDYQPARKFLEQLLSRRQEWGRLVELYEQELQQTSDRDQKVFLLTRIGTLAEEKLDSLEMAQRAYGRILDFIPGHLNAIRALARIADAQEQWQELLRLYELEVDATEDQKEVVAILHRAGTVVEDKLEDRATAMGHYEKALTLNPTYLPALRSLGRLYHQEKRWDDLLAMYRRELESARSPEQKVALLFSVAGVLQDEKKNDDEAAQALEQVLDMQPGNLPALRALAEIHRRQGRDEALVEVLKREAESLSDPKDKAETLMRVATILEERLDRTDQSAEVYQEVLRLGVRVEAAVRALVRIYTAEGLWNALSRALKSALEHAHNPRSRAAILLRLAEVAADRLGNRDGAAEYLESALELEPNSPTILSQLDRLSVARRDWKRAVEVSTLLAQNDEDPRAFAARQIRLAQMKETQLDPPESGAEHYRLALETVPDHPVALRALELAYRRAGDFKALASFYHREALVTDKEQRKVSLLCRAAELYESYLSDDSQAAQLYDGALEREPNSLAALRGRRRVAERQGEVQVALDAIRREGELCADDERGIELLFEAGHIYETQLGDNDRAIETYTSVLARRADHRPAFERLEQMYLETERWTDLKALLLGRAEAVPNREEQAALLLATARVSEERLGERTEAIQLYRRVLERNEMHPEALVHLGPLLFATQSWDEAVDVLHRTLAVTKEPQFLASSFKSLGIIYQEHRRDLVKCVQSFQAALQADGGDQEVLERLGGVYREAEDWQSASNVLLRLAEVQEPRERVATLTALGETYEEGMNDPKNAILAYRKVMDIEPTNQQAVLRLLRLHETMEDWTALADTTATYVSLLPPQDKEKAAPLHLKMAEVFETRLNDDSRAINALKYALDARPDDEEALVRLARLHARSPDTFPRAVDAHRRLLASDPFRVESYHEMHRMFERRGEHDKAFVVAEILVFLRAQAQDEDLYYHEHKAKVAPKPEGSLAPAEHDRWITHPEERGPIRAILEILGPELSKSFPGDMSRYEMNPRNDKHGTRSALPMRKTADDLATALGGVPLFDLWITSRFDLDLFVENEKPLALVVGANVGKRIQDRDQRFLLARQLERIKGGHHLLKAMSFKDLEALVWAAAQMGDPSVQTPVDMAKLEVMQRHLRSIPGRSRKALEEVGRVVPTVHVDLERHTRAAAHTANRAGLVMTNEIEAAVRNLAKDHPDIRPVFRDAQGAADTVGRIPAIRELLNYAVSEEYFSARARLGFSIER